MNEDEDSGPEVNLEKKMIPKPQTQKVASFEQKEQKFE